MRAARVMLHTSGSAGCRCSMRKGRPGRDRQRGRLSAPRRDRHAAPPSAVAGIPASAAGRLATEFVRACGRKVGEMMTPSPRTITEDTPLDEIVQLMERHRIKRLPVVEDGKLVGMVSRADLMHALASLRSATAEAAPMRCAAHPRSIGRLGTQSWAPRRSMSGARRRRRAVGRDHRRAGTAGI